MHFFVSAQVSKLHHGTNQALEFINIHEWPFLLPKLLWNWRPSTCYFSRKVYSISIIMWLHIARLDTRTVAAISVGTPGHPPFSSCYWINIWDDANSTTMMKWKLMFMNTTNARAWFPCEGIFKLVPKWGKFIYVLGDTLKIVILHWNEWAIFKNAIASHLITMN